MHYYAYLNDCILIFNIHLALGDSLHNLRSVPYQVKLISLSDNLYPVTILYIFDHVHKFLNAV